MYDHIPINAHTQLTGYLAKGEILEDKQLLSSINQVRDCQDLSRIIDSLVKLATSLGTLKSTEKMLTVRLNSPENNEERKLAEEIGIAIGEACGHCNKLITAHKTKILSMTKGE